MEQTQPPKKLKQPNTRWLTAILGLIFLIIGQYQIAQNESTAAAPTRVGIWLLEVIHIGVPSIDNIVRGLPVLLVGAALLFVSLRGMKLLPEESPVRQDVGIFLEALKALWPWLAAAVAIFALLLWQISYLPYSTLMLIEWLLAPLLALAAIVMWDTQRQVNLSPGIGRKDLLWMLGIFTLSILIGVYRLEGMPDMLIGDEGSFWLTARDLAAKVYSPSIFANGVYTFPVMSSIAQASVLKVFESSLWGWRFSSVLAGALTVFPLYILAKDTFNRRVAVASSFALAFSPYFLAFARLGYNNIQSLFITTLALYWVYTGVRRSSFLYVFLAGCAAGLGFYTYFSARMVIVIVLLFIGVLWLARKIKFRQAVLYIGLLLFGAILLMLPYIEHGRLYDTTGMSYKVLESMFFNTYNGEQFFTREELSAVAPFFTIGSVEFFYNPRIYLILILRGVLRTLITFQKAGIISEHFISYPLTGTIGVLFYLLGFGSMWKRIKEPRNILLLLWFIVVLFGLSALNTVPPRHTHIVNIIPLFALLIGIGVNLMVGSVAGFIKKIGPRLQTTLLGLFIALLVVSGTHDYFVLMPREYFPQPDQVVSWAGFSATDETLVYVYQEGVEGQTILPYSTEEFRDDIEYRMITWEELQSDPQAYNDGEKYVFFYLPGMIEQVEPLLSQLWGTDFIGRAFYNPDNAQVLAAGMNTPFVFERDRTFGQILKISYLRLPLLLFLAFCMLLLGIAAFLPVRWLEKIPGPIKAFFAWFNVPSEPLPAQTYEEAGAADEKVEFIEREPVPVEPPEWASEVFPKQETGTGKWVRVNGKTARDADGRDLYLRIHIPAITFRSGWKLIIPDLELPSHLLLFLSIVSAIAAQLLISRAIYLIGAILYAACAALFIVWARMHPKWMGALTNHVKIQPKAEVVIAIVLLLAVIFTRVYDLGYRVYGIEADESKWTVQAWYSGILHVDKGEFASMHYQHLPVTFWVRAFFLQLFGMDFISARIESATHSIIAVIFLYLIVRRLFSNPPVALLAASLYAFSYVELNTSHQALHNTTIEGWMMTGLYFIIYALQTRKTWAFQMAGFLLALGMLTYETIFPTIGVGILSVVAVAVWETIKRRASIVHWLTRVVLVLWPIVLAYFMFIQSYLQQEQYHFGWMDQGNGSVILSAITYISHNVGMLLESMFHGVIMDDALLRWNGSYISQFLLPFAVIGLVFNLLNLRRPYMLFIPVWYLLNVGAAPISVGAVWPRILYSSLAPLMIWGALGLWVSFGVLRSWIDNRKLRLSPYIFLALVLTIFVTDYNIFTNKIGDPLDRVQRRELADITTQAAAEADFLLYPYMPTYNDAAQVETHMIVFSVSAQHDGILEVDEYYQQVPYEELLASLWEHRDLQSVEIIYDKSRPENEERAATLAMVLQCYPDTTRISEGQFFDVYRLEADTLTNPVCYQAPSPSAVAPIDGTSLPSGLPVKLEWDSGVESTGFHITLQRETPNIYWIEAEDVFTENGWYVNSTFVLDFTGTGFVEDNWGSSEVIYNLNVEEAGEYQVWVRSYKRRINDQVNYIGINGEYFQFASNDNPENEWIWESIGTFNLPAGPSTISLNRTYGQDEQYSVFIDAVLLTPNLNTAPEDNQVWQTVISDKELSNTNPYYQIEEELEPGTYRWNVRVFDGYTLVDSLGDPGILMPFSTFTIEP